METTEEQKIDRDNDWKNTISSCNLFAQKSLVATNGQRTVDIKKKKT